MQASSETGQHTALPARPRVIARHALAQTSTRLPVVQGPDSPRSRPLPIPPMNLRRLLKVGSRFWGAEPGPYSLIKVAKHMAAPFATSCQAVLMRCFRMQTPANPRCLRLVLTNL